MVEQNGKKKGKTTGSSKGDSILFEAR